MRSRRFRTMIGVSSLMLAAFAAFYVVMNMLIMNRTSSAFGGVSQNIAALALVTAVIYGLGGAAYLGIGLWNLIARRTDSAAPVIAAIIISGLAILLILISLVETTALGRAPQLGGLAVNAVMLSRAIMTLRVKKSAAYAPRGH